MGDEDVEAGDEEDEEGPQLFYMGLEIIFPLVKMMMEMPLMWKVSSKLGYWHMRR